MVCDDPLQADDEVDLELRPAPDAARRMIAVAAICRRFILEAASAAGANETLEEDRLDLRAWLRSEGLRDAFSSDEWELVESPVGDLAPDLVMEGFWRTESVLSLSWALGLLDALPSPMEDMAQPGWFDQIPAPWDSTLEVTQSAKLRSLEVIAAERERWELWDWRAGVADLYQTTSLSERDELDQAVRDVAHESFASGLISLPLQDDFAVGSTPFGELPVVDRHHIGNVASERLRAFDWLCGLREWSDDASHG